MFRSLLLTSFFLITLFTPQMEDKTTVFIIGDSTAANKLTTAYPETGWGMPFTYFFDKTVEVNNLAKNGRSTRTFLSEGLWD
ncbi:MAG: GntR family transcriptional regulator, partial [Pedobacter sp.]|nr:GntR family transcriptional regulator [Pedobacter sp.]